MIEPGGTIGILGGGQLGRMLAIAAARLGLKAHIYAPEAASPAFDVAAAATLGGYGDQAALATFAKAVDVVTYEFENVPAETVEILTRLGADVAPGAKALAVAQDRLVEKEFARSIGAETALFHAIDDLGDLEEGLKLIGRPAILKTRRLGYDGKGQTRLGADASDLGTAWADANKKAWDEVGANPSILEGFIDFQCEISIIGARGRDGAVALYDPPRNTHRDGILRTSSVPAGVAETSVSAALKIARRILDELDYVGVIGVEYFVCADGSVLFNEFAPRVHNSGHWTLDACAVSQFEQHIRAVAGWPLGSTERHSDAVMENLIGDEINECSKLAAEPNACLHVYGKGAARPGRKMGHVTRVKARS